MDDHVVLDLVYEARDIEQGLGSKEKVDAWFEAKTKGLNAWQRTALREQWATMQIPSSVGSNNTSNASMHRNGRRLASI